jgi:hypothetical protein
VSAPPGTPFCPFLLALVFTARVLEISRFFRGLLGGGRGQLQDNVSPACSPVSAQVRRCPGHARRTARTTVSPVSGHPCPRCPPTVRAGQSVNSLRGTWLVCCCRSTGRRRKTATAPGCRREPPSLTSVRKGDTHAHRRTISMLSRRSGTGCSGPALAVAAACVHRARHPRTGRAGGRGSGDRTPSGHRYRLRRRKHHRVTRTLGPPRVLLAGPLAMRNVGGMSRRMADRRDLAVDVRHGRRHRRTGISRSFFKILLTRSERGRTQGDDGRQRGLTHLPPALAPAPPSTDKGVKRSASDGFPMAGPASELWRHLAKRQRRSRLGNSCFLILDDARRDARQ